MTLVRGCDSATPPSDTQISDAKRFGVTFWGVYFGGRGAYNVWTLDQVHSLAAKGFRILPIWVPSQPLGSDNATPTLDASTISAEMIAGAKLWDIPTGCFLALDAEPALSHWLSSNPDIQTELTQQIADAGYHLVIYGVAALRVPEWQAAWNRSTWPESLGAGSNVVVWQWSGSSASASVPNVDLDVMLANLFNELWTGEPLEEPLPSAPTNDPPILPKGERASVPVLVEGDTGRPVQVMTYALSLYDGGPITDTWNAPVTVRVRNFQREHEHLNLDETQRVWCGAGMWSALIGTLS